MLSFFNRKKLILTVGILLAAYVGWAYVRAGGYLASLPLVMTPTAHAAFLFFWMAFTASSIHALMPSAYSKWAMRNRRYVGLSFALIHFVHAALVLLNIGFTEESRPLPVFLAGVGAYILLFLMTITSNNTAVKKLGPKNWKRLHKWSSYVIWVVFASQISKPDVFMTVAATWIPVGAIMALLLRIGAHQKKKKRA
jgi:sulfoxide reductase heme-binding subunit YedZ